MLIILVIVLVLFGAGKIPEVFEALGTGLKKFREAQDDDLGRLARGQLPAPPPKGRVGEDVKSAAPRTSPAEPKVGSP